SLVLRISEHALELGSGTKPEQSGPCRNNGCFHSFCSHRPADTLPAREGALVQRPCAIRIGCAKAPETARQRAPVAQFFSLNGTAILSRAALARTATAANPLPAVGARSQLP